MIENLRPEDVQRNAQRIGENLRASLFYLADLISGHNEESADQVDPASVVSTAAIKFVKPTGGMISGLKGQFNILLVQVVPVEPSHTLGHIIEQGYHVVPSNMLSMWKQIILDAHANAVNDLLEAFAEEEGEEVAVGDDQPDETAEGAGEYADEKGTEAGAEESPQPVSEASEEV